MRVKICGITSLEDAEAAVAAGADAIGFNFADGARKKNRYIDPEAAREIVASLPAFVATVAVTVNATVQEIDAYLEFTEYVQLHGEESPEFCRRYGRRAIKALRIGPDFVPDTVLEYPVGAILLDAYVAGARGGTGAQVDWDVARRVAENNRPIILAGGLTPDNVREAIGIVNPYAVDVAGGVEAQPGKKDHERLRRFIDQAKLPLS